MDPFLDVCKKLDIIINWYSAISILLS
jgi:hypothetical protein